MFSFFLFSSVHCRHFFLFWFARYRPIFGCLEEGGRAVYINTHTRVLYWAIDGASGCVYKCAPVCYNFSRRVEFFFFFKWKRTDVVPFVTVLQMRMFQLMRMGRSSLDSWRHPPSEITLRFLMFFCFFPFYFSRRFLSSRWEREKEDESKNKREEFL